MTKRAIVADATTDVDEEKAGAVAAHLEATRTFPMHQSGTYVDGVLISGVAEHVLLGTAIPEVENTNEAPDTDAVNEEAVDVSGTI